MLEASDQALIFFNVSMQDAHVSFQMIDNMLFGYGCDITSHMLSRLSPLSPLTLFAVDNCANDGALVGVLDVNSRNTIALSNILFSHETSFKPFAAHMG